MEHHYDHHNAGRSIDICFLSKVKIHRHCNHISDCAIARIIFSLSVCIDFNNWLLHWLSACEKFTISLEVFWWIETLWPFLNKYLWDGQFFQTKSSALFVSTLGDYSTRCYGAHVKHVLKGVGWKPDDRLLFTLLAVQTAGDNPCRKAIVACLAANAKVALLLNLSPFKQKWRKFPRFSREKMTESKVHNLASKENLPFPFPTVRTPRQLVPFPSIHTTPPRFSNSSTVRRRPYRRRTQLRTPVFHALPSGLNFRAASRLRSVSSSLRGLNDACAGRRLVDLCF